MNIRKSTVVQKVVSSTLLLAFALFNVAPLTAQNRVPRKNFGDFNTSRLPDAIVNQPADADQPAAKNYEPALNDDADIIHLNAEPLNITSDRAREMRRAAPDFSGKRLHLVKFGGAIQPAGFAALRASGFEVVNYIPNYAYLVYGDSNSVQRMRQIPAQKAADRIVWDGEYLPEFKIQPGVFTFDKDAQSARLGAERFTVQLFRDEATNNQTVALLENLSGGETTERSEILSYVNVTVKLDADGIRQISARPDVISIHAELEPHKNDERQDRIITGNVSGNGIVAGDHLSYLAGKGFTQGQFDTSNFSVNVVDDGLDGGTVNPTHFGLFRQGDPSTTSRIVFNRPYGTATATDAQGCDGHGTLNGHIVGGYVPTGGIFAAFPHADTSGYRYGLGVAPFVKLGSSTIFNNAGSFTNPNIINMESEAYRDGSRISTNSWGASSNVYNARAQAYDAQVRDAQPGTASVPVAGNQEYTIIFAAGNDGSVAGTVGNPGVAKNVITVGASENVHPFGGADGCAIDDTGANSLNDIISFSSRGPTSDQRRKPEIVAPGTHVTGGLYQQSLVSPVSGTGNDNSCFDASGVCKGVNSNFFPSSGQQWYTASSGTSHSTPAVAGGAALVRQYFLNQNLGAPSPAMTKAVLMNGASYMNGTGANDNLWSNSQGMGLMNLDRAFNTVSGAKLLRDQIPTDKFTASGQVRTYTFTVADGAQPVRATLAWTDAPGATTGNAYVNNLDLEVIVNGQTYLGNVFTGANSVTGGTADVRNNAESIFFPAGALPTGATVVVRVKATNIAGDGVANDADALDQDFAIVVSNANVTLAAAIANNAITIVSENATPANNTPDPGETLTVRVPLQNYGTANSSSNVTVTLLPTGGVTNPSGPQNYGTLVAGGAAVARDFTFTVSSAAACGSQITLTFQIQDGSNTSTFTQTYTLGALAVIGSQNFDAVTAPALPTGWTSATTGSGTGWATSTTTPASAPNAAFAGNPSTAGESTLQSPAFNVTSSAARLDFKINYDTEDTYDGAVLEIKIGAGAYQDIVTAGGSFISGGYNGTIRSTATTNPLVGRAAWTNNSGGYVSASVTLPAAANNQSVQFRWRMGSDNLFGDTGVRLDDVQLFSGFVCAAPAATADVSVSITDAPDPVTVGSNLTYTITATSAGPGAATTATLSDALPTGTTFVSLTNPAGWSCTTPTVGANGTVSCSNASFAAGNASFTLTVAVTASVSGGTIISNTVTVGAANDSNAANNSATATTTVSGSANLSVTNVDSPDPVAAGGNLSYAITVNNAGPNSAATVSLSDTLPANTTFVSLANPAGWNCTTPAVGGVGTVTCTNSSLAVGNAAFTLVVKVSSGTASGTVISNTATVTSATSDPTPGNESATATTTVNASADLSVTNTDSPDPVAIGGNLAYALSVSNAGPSDAATVVLTDTLPTGTTFVSLVQNTGAAFSCTTPAVGASGTVTCTAASLTANATAAFTLTVRVANSVASGTTLTNTATVSSATTDPTAANNSATATTAVVSPAIVTGTKTVSGTYTIGGTVTYTVTLTNSGGGAQQNNPGSEFVDVLPSGLTLLSASSTSGTTVATVATRTVTFNGAIPAGGSVTITITARVNPGTEGQTIANQGTINYDADGNGTNETSTVTDDPTVTGNNNPTTFVAAAITDLALQMTGTAQAAAGSNLIYTIRVNNNGPSAAENVMLVNQIPTGTTYQSVSFPSGWKCRAPSGTRGAVRCTRVSFANGDEAVFAIRVRVNPTTAAGTSVFSQATVETDTPETTLTNNASSTTTAVTASGGTTRELDFIESANNTESDFGSSIFETPLPIISYLLNTDLSKKTILF